MGLREQIANAGTAEEVNDLLVVGAAFEQASNKTRRAWQRTADRRVKELSR